MQLPVTEEKIDNRVGKLSVEDEAAFRVWLQDTLGKEKVTAVKVCIPRIGSAFGILLDRYAVVLLYRISPESSRSLVNF